MKSAPTIVLADDLRRTIGKLAGEIGERNVWHPEKLSATVRWIEQELAHVGYSIRRQEFLITVPGPKGFSRTVHNVEVELRGTVRAEEIVIAGAHYDSRVAMPGWHVHGPPWPEQAGTPGAGDNASGIAGVLALAKYYSSNPQSRTIRFVFFVNEEPPFYQTPQMGSWVYAKGCRERGENVVGMIALDTVGCYSEHPRTKRNLFYKLFGPVFNLPDQHDYVAFVSNWKSKRFVQDAAKAFRACSNFPLRTAAIPALHRRFAWSDDWSFWEFDYPAFCVTDTAYLRHDDYHELDDLPDKIDYSEMARVTEGLMAAIKHLAN